MKAAVERRARAWVRDRASRRVPAELRAGWLPPPVEADVGWRQRLDRFRREVIPWLARTRPLSGASILEVGCGLGASTLALAEQGAQVTAIDIDPAAVAGAQRLLDPIGLDIDLRAHDAARIGELGVSCDWVIFWATVEHLTFRERIAGLRQAWDQLPRAGLLTLVETPNRLWPYDSHTSRLPYYSWLPDDLAFAYAAISPRETFGGGVYQDFDTQLEDFLRRGRGASFHEFDLAIGDHRALEVTSCMQLERRRRSPLRRVGWALSRDGSAERAIRSYSPGTHRAWFQPFLYLTLEK